MAQLRAYQGRFPDSRAGSCLEKAYETLLWRWDTIKYGEKTEPGLIQKLGGEIRHIDIQAAMWHLAFRSLLDKQAEGQVSLALLHGNTAKSISVITGGAGQTFIQHIQDRSGILLERAPGAYLGFPIGQFKSSLLAERFTRHFPDFPAKHPN